MTTEEKDSKTEHEQLKSLAIFDHDADAQAYLAECYMTGNMENLNVQMAIEYYRKAAEQAHENALASLFEFIEQHPLSDQITDDLLHFAATRGHVESRKRLLKQKLTKEKAVCDDINRLLDQAKSIWGLYQLLDPSSDGASEMKKQYREILSRCMSRLHEIVTQS